MLGTALGKIFYNKKITFWPSSNFLSTSVVKGLAEGGGSNIFWYFRSSEGKNRET